MPILLPLLLIIPVAGGLLALWPGPWRAWLPRWIALVSAALCLGLSGLLWAAAGWPRLSLARALTQPGPAWLLQYRADWIPSLGIQFHLALDGLSLLLLVLTWFLGLVAVLLAWRTSDRPSFYFLNLLWMLAGVTGIFLAVDLFLFFTAWEVMLVPLYFLIVLWGGEQREAAGLQFFLFTQCSGLLLLVALLELAFAHHPGSGWSFDYTALLGSRYPPAAGVWIMLGFLAAFAVKLPLFPLHTWQPTAFVAAPTPVCITGLLLEVGGYGLIRFLFPLFPAAAHAATPVVMGLAVAGILYSAWIAMAQTSLKRLIAYGSIAHVSFVALGVFAWNRIAVEGAVVMMIAHALSTGALFILMGWLYQRTRSASLEPLGGLWSVVPRFGAATLFFLLASIGLPGLADFVGEFLVLLGVYRVSPVMAALAALGVVASTVYALRLIQLVFHGPEQRSWDLPDLAPREWGVLVPFALALLFLGLYPRPVLATFRPVLDHLLPPESSAVTALPDAVFPRRARP